jgi:hypothetical protein
MEVIPSMLYRLKLKNECVTCYTRNQRTKNISNNNKCFMRWRSKEWGGMYRQAGRAGIIRGPHAKLRIHTEVVEFVLKTRAPTPPPKKTKQNKTPNKKQTEHRKEAKRKKSKKERLEPGKRNEAATKKNTNDPKVGSENTNGVRKHK